MISHADSSEGPFSGADAAIIAEAFRKALRRPDIAGPIEEGSPKSQEQHRPLSREREEGQRDIRSVEQLAPRPASVYSPNHGSSVLSHGDSLEQPFLGADAVRMADAFRKALRKPDFAGPIGDSLEGQEQKEHRLVSRELAEEGRDIVGYAEQRRRQRQGYSLLTSPGNQLTIPSSFFLGLQGPCMLMQNVLHFCLK